MAYTLDAPSKRIIDLTEAEGEDDNLRTLSTAASRAEMAASRLVTQFESAVLHRHREPTAQLPSPRAQIPTASPRGTQDSVAIGRKPRGAAIDASNQIAEAYRFLNPLEETLEASLTTPKKPGRPKKDEWTPTSHSSGVSEDPWSHRRLVDTYPASPTSGLSKSMVVNGQGKFHLNNKVAYPPPLKKRKVSGPDRGSSAKIMRIEGPQGQDSKEGKNIPSQSSAQEPSLRVIRDCQRVLPPKDAALRTPVKPASNPIAKYDPAPHSPPSIHDMPKGSVQDIIKDGMRRYKRPHDIDPLGSISQAVTSEAIEENLELLKAQRPYRTPGNQYEEAGQSRIQERQGMRLKTEYRQHKRFIKRRFNELPAEKSTAPSVTLEPALPEPAIPEYVEEKGIAIKDAIRSDKQSNMPRILDLTSYLNKLETDACGNNVYSPEQMSRFVKDVPSVGPSRSDHAETAIPLPPTGTPAAAPSATNPFSDQPFPPGFDRGRFPAQRRRRGNKFFTPPKPRTAPMVSNTQSFHSSNPVSRGKSASTRSLSLRGPSQTVNTKEMPVPSHSRTRPNEWKALVVKRANSDPEFKELIRVVASGKGTKPQIAELQAYIDRLRLSSNSDERGLTETHPQSGFGGLKIPNGFQKFPQSSSSIQSLIDPSNMKHRVNLLQNSLSGNYIDSAKLGQLGCTVVDSPTRQPIHDSRSSASAYDSQLERLISDIIIDGSDIPKIAESNWCMVYEDDQRQLVDKTSIIKHINSSCKSPSSKAMTPVKLVMIESRVVDPFHRSQRSTASLLRHRELGSDPRGRHIRTENALRLRNAEKIEPWRSWKGASGDVVSAAWAADSTTYAFGAAAPTNDEDLQYNRPCNLLLGDLNSNTLTELPDHRVKRPQPQSITGGPNASQAVYDACDPMVYKTVTAIAFSPTGNCMYTASHDQTVKAWETSSKKCLYTLHHNAWVTSIETSSQTEGLFATATKTRHDSIRIFNSAGGSVVSSHFSSSRAEMRLDCEIYPECLRWGTTPQTSHLLLAGFQQWGDVGNESGQLMLWDAHASQSIKVSPSSQSVYAAAWHPHSLLFATGGSPGNVVSNRRSTKSVVRTWDVRSTTRYTMEYECSALDMQDVTFSPADSYTVTAGCTDGTSYVWDFRRPDKILHRLRHGWPIIELDHTKDREEADTGVMMSVWGLGGTLLYTGSSDGMIKAWDVRRHPADVLVRNVAQFGAGVLCGALSPDGTNLLVGDADGGIHILSSAPCERYAGHGGISTEGAEEAISLIRAPDGSGSKLEKDEDDPVTVGRDVGRRLIEDGELSYHPDFGVTKGPNCRIFWARDSRKEPKGPNKVGKLLPYYAKLQAFSKRGEEREDIAQRRRGIIKARKLKIDSELAKVTGDPSPMTKSEASWHTAADSFSQAEEVVETLKETMSQRRFINNYNSNFIDLTEDEPSPQTHIELTRAIGPSSTTIPILADYDDVEDNIITESDMVEENYWWPHLGEEEIARARDNVTLGRG